MFLVTIVVACAVSRDSLTSLAICGLISLPAVHALCRGRLLHAKPLLLLVGGYSLAIYLFNNITIGLVKGVMFEVIDWNGPRFLIFVPVLLLTAVVGPIVLKRGSTVPKRLSRPDDDVRVFERATSDPS